MSQLEREDMREDYADLVELAKICGRHSREANTRGVAAELWKLARDYQQRAARTQWWHPTRHRRATIRN